MITLTAFVWISPMCNFIWVLNCFLQISFLLLFLLGFTIKQQVIRPMLSMVFSKLWFVNTEAMLNRGITLQQTLHQRRYWEQYVWHPPTEREQFVVWWQINSDSMYCTTFQRDFSRQKTADSRQCHSGFRAGLRQQTADSSDSSSDSQTAEGRGQRAERGFIPHFFFLVLYIRIK